MWLMLGCRPTASTDPSGSSEDPEPATTATAHVGSSSASSSSERPTEPTEGAPDREPDSLPDTCTIELELVEPTGASGKGKSDVSNAEAKDDAWAQACAALQHSHGVDCHDADRVGTIKEASQSIQARRGDGRHQNSFRYEVELGLRRRAKGFGDAPGDRQEACRRAKDHACQELVGSPCPATGLRVLSVDGRPPSAAAVEPRPTTVAPRPTI